MKIAFLTTDARTDVQDYSNPRPYFGTAPEALLHGFADFPELEIHVISCTRQPLKSPEKLGVNIWYHSLQVPRIGWLRTGYQGCIRAVRRKLKTLQPDIAHGQGTERDCALDAVFSGFPSVVTIHGNMREIARIQRARIGSYLWCAAQLEGLALKGARGVLCNSRHTEKLVSSRAQRTWLAPNPLRPEFLSNQPRIERGTDCILLHVGAVCENKQQLEMLQLARDLHRRRCSFKLHFIGRAEPTTDYTRRFFEQIREAEREGYARFLGPRSVDELVTHFDRATALVHTPKEEAFGLVVAEALARNLKFLGFRVGGVAEIAEGVPDTELVAPGDWHELGNAIANWLDAGSPKPSPALELMRNRYSPMAIASRHVQIYREALARQTPQAPNDRQGTTKLRSVKTSAAYRLVGE